MWDSSPAVLGEEDGYEVENVEVEEQKILHSRARKVKEGRENDKSGRKRKGEENGTRGEDRKEETEEINGRKIRAEQRIGIEIRIEG